MNCEKNESFSRLRCATAFRFSGLSTGIKDKISLSAPSTLALRLRCFLRGVWRDRSFGAVPRSARGVTERDVWMDLGDGGARDGAKVGVFRSACALAPSSSVATR